MKPKLYGYWRSSSTWRVRIALAYKGIPYDTAPVHLVREGGEQHSAWFKAMNPAGQVPVLEVDDGAGGRAALTQSTAILEYLEELAPEPPLLPEDAVARSQARALAQVINSGVQPLQNLGVLQALAARGVDQKAWAREWIARGLGVYDSCAARSAGRYSVGDAVSVADLLLIPQLYNARRFEVDLQPFARLLGIEAACFELPAFLDSHPDRQMDAEK